MASATVRGNWLILPPLPGKEKDLERWYCWQHTYAVVNPQEGCFALTLLNEHRFPSVVEMMSAAYWLLPEGEQQFSQHLASMRKWKKERDKKKKRT